MMLQPKRIAEYRKIWLQLKANGYDVIPLLEGKEHPFRGWPNLPNDPAAIATWNGRAAAIRMFGSKMFIVDLDTRLEVARDAVLAMLEQRWPDFLARCLRRHSGAVKIALIGRSETEARTTQSRSWYPDPAIHDKEQKNQIEVFTGNSRKYVGVHGVHSPGREYGYHGRSILEVPVDQLPWFPGDQIGALVDACDEVMATCGLFPREAERTASSARIQYDLTPDLVFRLKDGDEMSLVDLEKYVKQCGRQEGYPSFLDPQSESEDRIKVNLSDTGLALWDTKTEISHRWVSAEPVDVTELGEKIKDAADAAGLPIPEAAPNWRERYENGSVKASLHNARLGIEAGGFVCAHDVFHNRMWIGRGGAANPSEPLPRFCGEVTDNRIASLRGWMSDRYGRDFTEKHIRDAVIQMAVENAFNPVTDMLAEAEANWDGVERLDRMAVDYFNCADTPVNRQCVRKTMIAAVARARNPGCKFDTILVMESPEGWNKSSVWLLLAGSDDNFSDESIIGKDSREVQEQLAGIWIHENAELAGLNKAEVRTIKSFASRTVDRARPAYGHFQVMQSRHSIEVGTTNSAEYLPSQTGNRRFWPIKILAPIDLGKLRAARLQLWGEAAHWQSQGERLTLDEALWPAAGVEQEARRVAHPWEAKLAAMSLVATAGPLAGVGYIGNGVVHRVGIEERVSTRVIFEHVLELKAWQMHRGHSITLGEIMRLLGWEHALVRIDGIPVKGYKREVS